MGSEQTQWVITLTFAVLGVLSLIWLVSDLRRPLLVVSNLLHLAMAVTMVAMTWVSLGVGWTTVLLVVFGLGAVWFGVLAGLRATRRVKLRAVGEHGVWQLIAHAVMMLAMVWMLAVMAGGHHHDGLPAGPTLSGVAATAALVVTGVLLTVALVECVATSRNLRRHAGDLAGGAVMSLGMAAACWAMLG